MLVDNEKDGLVNFWGGVAPLPPEIIKNALLVVAQRPQKERGISFC